VVTAVIAVLAVGVTGAMSHDSYNALTGGLQAIGVVIALGLGAATLMRDSHDKRLDRVLALHQELMTGDLWRARHRLVAHLGRLGRAGRTRIVTREELRSDPELSHYLDVPDARPLDDADLLMRFFERANAARTGTAVEQRLFADLIGRHSLWWDLAFARDDQWLTRQGLTDLATWCTSYVRDTASRRPDLLQWLTALDKDFEPRLEGG
jgi:hypothetical protein